MMVVLSIAAGVLSGCAVYVPDQPGVVVRPQGGPGNGFCPPGQAKKGNCWSATIGRKRAWQTPVFFTAQS